MNGERTDMPGENAIFAYYQAIKSGAVTVGRWIRLVYEMLVSGIEEKRFFFDQHGANAAIDWMEAHGFHVEGALAPGSIKLELWQKAFVSAIFGIKDEKGNPQFREIFLLIGRKNGKSLLASLIGNYVFRVAGGYGARVYCLAPKLDQADIVYNNLWQMITLDPEWQAEEELKAERDEHNKKIHDDSCHARHRQTDLSIPGTNSTVKKIAFSAKRSDGFNPSLCIADEVAAWEGDNGLKQYEVMRSGMGARPDGRLLSCTTAGYVNDSVFDELMKRSTRMLLGDSKEKRLLPLLYMLDDPEEWNDITKLPKSLPNLGVSVSVDYMLEEIAVAEGSLSKRREFLCKYGCLKQNSSLAWLEVATVNKACGEELHIEDFRDSYCIIGLDLSQTTDLTAAVCVIEKDGELYCFGKCWLPGEKMVEASQRDGLPYSLYQERGLIEPSGENFIDYHDCFEWIMHLINDLQILPLRVMYDRYSAAYLVQDLEQAGAVCDPVYQGENLSGIINETEGLLKDGRIHIGDNDLFKAHLLDSAIKMSVERGRGRLVKVRPTAHIDLTAALLDAICGRQKWWSEIGDMLKNSG